MILMKNNRTKFVNINNQFANNRPETNNENIMHKSTLDCLYNHNMHAGLYIVYLYGIQELACSVMICLKYM